MQMHVQLQKVAMRGYNAGSCGRLGASPVSRMRIALTSSLHGHRHASPIWTQTAHFYVQRQVTCLALPTRRAVLGEKALHLGYTVVQANHSVFWGNTCAAPLTRP